MCFVPCRCQLRTEKRSREKSGESERLLDTTGEVATVGSMRHYGIGEEPRNTRLALAETQRRMDRMEALVAGDVRRDVGLLVAIEMAGRAQPIDAPRRACVLPPWDFDLRRGLSDEEQKPEVWKKRQEEWQQGGSKAHKGLFTKTTRLFLVCARTDRLVPCGHEGRGYLIECARTWFRAAVNLTSLTASLVVAASGLAAIGNVPGSIVGALAEQAINTGVDAIASELDNAAEAGDDNAIDVNHYQQVHVVPHHVHAESISLCFARLIGPRALQTKSAFVAVFPHVWRQSRRFCTSKIARDRMLCMRFSCFA